MRRRRQLRFARSDSAIARNINAEEHLQFGMQQMCEALHRGILPLAGFATTSSFIAK